MPFGLLLACALSVDMPSDATALAAKLGLGWNLGNSLEACSNADSADELLWGNPKTSRELIFAVKAAGFNFIRVPCAWSGYIINKTTYEIRPSWLARVQEVVGYIVDARMYAMINIHWDGGWLEEHPMRPYQEANNKKLAAIWRQIATTLEPFDEHVLFAGANETHEGWSSNPPPEVFDVHLSYMQTFVTAVRATGGNNALRNLIVPAYKCDIRLAVKYYTPPKDTVKNRLFCEVHYYEPWDFCGENGNVYLWDPNTKGSHTSRTGGRRTGWKSRSR
jgi:endoglucanase